MEFKKLELSDMPLFNSFFSKYSSLSSVYDFATIYEWDYSGKTEFTVADECIIVRNYWINKFIYYFICDNNADITTYIQIVEREEEGKRFHISQIPTEQLKYINGLAGYNQKYDRDYSDYIYLTEDLISLAGKKLHSKRNHLNKFKSLYNGIAVFREYTESDRAEIEQLYSKWEAESETDGTVEKIALFRAIDNMDALGIKCPVIEIDGKIAAFGIVSKSVNNVGQVHFEKADIQYEGIYAAINNFEAKDFLNGCVYINRQEDMGIEGLRKAKLSYHPHKIFDKYILKRVIT